MSTEDTLSLARRHVAAIKGFYIHLAVFVLVNALLLVLNASTGAPWWAQWPLLGWGIGVIGHAIAVFGSAPGALARWEARKTEEVKRRLDATAHDAARTPTPPA